MFLQPDKKSNPDAKASGLYLYFHFEILFAMGAADGMMPFFAGEAEGGLAMGAAAVDMGFPLGKFPLLQPKPTLYIAGDPHIFEIFLLPLIKIFGK